MSPDPLDGTEIAMLYRGDSPHPAHAGFAAAVDADLLGLSRRSIPGLSQTVVEEIFGGLTVPSYDVYIVEGTRAMYGALASRLVTDGTLLYLAGDHAMYGLTTPEFEFTSPLNRLIAEYGIGVVRRLFTHSVDGVLAVSEFAADYTRRVIRGVPDRVANPYIVSDELFDSLGAVEPSLDRNVAVHVGTHSHYKGQDVLVDAWPRVRDRHPDARLRLVGEGYPDSFDEVPGVETLGYVEELPDTLADCSVYVQPSRADTFPVSVLEAMRAGLPPVVTTATGSTAVARPIDPGLVAKPTAADLAATVSAYFDRPVAERANLSAAARETGSTYDADTRRRAFREAFVELLAAVDAH